MQPSPRATLVRFGTDNGHGRAATKASPFKAVLDAEKDKIFQKKMTGDDVLCIMQAHLVKTQTRVVDLFRSIDASGDGEVTLEELRKGLLGFGFELSEEDFAMMYAGIDRDKSHQVSVKELSRALRDAEKAREAERLKGSPPPRPPKGRASASTLLRPRREKRPEPPRMRQEVLGKMGRGDEVLFKIKGQLNRQKTKMLDVFRALDESGDGAIDKKEFRAGLEKLGFDVSDEDFRALVLSVDQDGSGDISVREFHQALKLAERKARAEGRDQELDTFHAASASRVEPSETYDWAQRSVRVYSTVGSMRDSMREAQSTDSSWRLASGGPLEAALSSRLHHGSVQDSSIGRQRLFDTHVWPDALPARVTRTPRLPTYRNMYKTVMVTGRFGCVEPATPPSPRLATTSQRCKFARRPGPEVHLAHGVRKFPNLPSAHSTVDQVVFNRGAGPSGGPKTGAESAAAMFQDCAGLPSWHKAKE